MEIQDRMLLSGNEAVALAAYHVGVTLARAYPGTPSTAPKSRPRGMSSVRAEC